MTSFVDAAHKILLDYVTKKDAICQVVNDERKRNTVYNTAIREEKERELEALENKLTEKEQKAALDKLNTLIDRANSFLRVAAVEIDVDEIEKLEKIFSMGVPSDFVIENLIDNCTGSYWGLTFLSEKLNDGTVEGILKAPLRPDIPAYQLVINDGKDSVERFVGSYAGPETITMTDETAAQTLLMLGSNTWGTWKTRIDSICPAFATDLTLAGGALTVSERKTINTLLPPGLSETGKKAKVIELAASSDRWRSMLSRSKYALWVDEWAAQKEAEETQKLVTFTPFEQKWKEFLISTVGKEKADLMIADDRAKGFI